MYPRRSGKMRRVRKVKAKKSLKSSKAFKKAVQAVISSNAEDKQAYSSLPLTAFNSGINTYTDVVQIMPQISQGDQCNQRAGDQVRAKKLTVKGHVIMNLNSVSGGAGRDNRLCVRLMVVSPRVYQNSAVVAGTTAFNSYYSSLLKFGNTAGAFNGTGFNLYQQINTDAFTVHHDQLIYMNAPYATAVATTAGITENIGDVVPFNINVKCLGKILKYDVSADSSNTPTNFAPVLLCGYARVGDLSNPDSLLTQVSMTMFSELFYEDT